jgi:acetyl-CoA C-acetyltransferase
VVALDAGLPVTVGGMQVDRRCGSGLQSVIQACMQVASGDSEVVIAGGAESMSNVAFYSTDMRWGAGSREVRMYDGLTRGRVTAGGKHYPVPGGMLETAENLRRPYGVSRAEQDELAVQSHQRTGAAQRDGILAQEIIPVTVRSRSGEHVVDTDEHPRADTSLETLGKLKPFLAEQDPDATVTAGNASGQNDAASMWTSSNSTRPSPPRRWPSRANGASPRPTGNAPMPMDPASPSGIPWGAAVFEKVEP